MKTPNYIYKIYNPKRPGPRVVILGGTHGDELAGIEVIRKLIMALSLDQQENERSDISGEIYFGFGNPEAIALGRRGVDRTRDLNRSFSQNEIEAGLSALDRPDLVRARELAPLLKNTDYLIDLHAVSNPSPAFICYHQGREEHQSLCQQIPVKNILTDPGFVLATHKGIAEGATTDGYVNRNGGVGICYETGMENDIQCVDEVYQIIIRCLRYLGVVTEDFLKQMNFLDRPYIPRRQTVCELQTMVVAKENEFEYALSMNECFKEVEQGQIIGKYVSGKTEVIPDDGILLFPKGEKKIRQGNSLYYLAEKVEKD